MLCAIHPQVEGGIELWYPNSHPVASAKPAGTYARRHGLVPAALLGAWLPRPRMVSRRRGPPPPLLGWRRRRQREPGCLRGDAAGYIRWPRRSRPGTT